MTSLTRLTGQSCVSISSARMRLSLSQAESQSS